MSFGLKQELKFHRLDTQHKFIYISFLFLPEHSFTRLNFIYYLFYRHSNLKKKKKSREFGL